MSEEAAYYSKMKSLFLQIDLSFTKCNLMYYLFHMGMNLLTDNILKKKVTLFELKNIFLPKVKI